MVATVQHIDAELEAFDETVAALVAAVRADDERGVEDYIERLEVQLRAALTSPASRGSQK